MALARVLSLPVKSPSPSHLDLAIVIPTYNERGNVAELIRRLDVTLQGLSWEVLFVDDDSPDGTSDLVRSFARRDCRVRVLQRIGRRGLSSACVEGIMATSAEIVAVMDADMQHDESILPQMLHRLHSQSLDLVVGTRNADGGSMGQFAAHRQAISRVGRKLSHAVCKAELSDPMSGFFLMTRSFFMESVHGLQSNGFKILVDLFAASRRPVRFDEVGYRFRCRHHGESKFDLSTGVEYLLLVASRLSGLSLPTRFLLSMCISAFSIVTYLVALAIMLGASTRFPVNQMVATYITITAAFFLRATLLRRDPNASGSVPLSGLPLFWLVCSVGAVANVLLARTMLQAGDRLYVAGIAGMIVSMAWNDMMFRLLPWLARRHAAGTTPLAEMEAFTDAFE